MLFEKEDFSIEFGQLLAELINMNVVLGQDGKTRLAEVLT